MTTKNDGGPAFPMQETQAIHSYAYAAVQDIQDTEERDRVYMAKRAEAVGGMSLRDYFLAHAPITMIDANESLHLNPGASKFAKPDGDVFPMAMLLKELVRLRHEYADAMMAARSA